MNIFVTGAAGFIGSHLCEKLLSDGHRVVGLDNFDTFYDPQIKRTNITGLITKKEFSLIEGDIRDQLCIEKICSDNRFDILLHLAAKAGVRPSIENPLEYADVNVNGTLVLLEAARKHGIKKIIFASSSSVYGNNKNVPFAETDNVDDPISPYAATKKAGELLCHVYHQLYGIDMMCLRLFTVYGPRQRPDLAIHKFTSLIESGREIPVYGDGSMMRDFTYVGDIVDGVAAAMRECKGYEIYNLGESRPVRLDDLIAAIERALGKKAKIKRLPEQPGDVKQTYADVTKAMTRFGYQPKTDIEVGLQKFVEWFRSKQ
jgi:UDP-glucuronate 4-epimerase